VVMIKLKEESVFECQVWTFQVEAYSAKGHRSPTLFGSRVSLWSQAAKET
jgi:hypothetical protein